MALKGDLASVDLAQVFQMLALNQKVGLLCIQSPTRWKSLYFDERGVTLYFNEHTMLDRVLNKLVCRGILASDGVAEAREHAAQHSQRVVDGLLAGGYLTDEELNSSLCNEMEEEIYGLFFWNDAKFEFFEGATEYEGREGVIHDDFFFGTDMLIMEAARRIDEWGYIRSRVSNSLEIHRQSDSGANSFEMDESLVEVYDVIDGRRNVDRLIEISGLSPFHLFKDLARLIDENLIEAVPPEEMLELGCECMNEGRMQDAINLFERAAAQEVGIPEVYAHVSEAYDAIGEYELSAYHTKCRAEFAAAQGDLKEALELFRWVLESIPTDLAACQRIVELSVGHPELATQDLDPLRVGKDLVDLYLEIGEVDRVRSLLEELIRQHPTDIELKKSLINVHTKVGDTKRVVELYESIAKYLAKSGDPIQAINYLQKILQLDKSRKDISEQIKQLYQADERKRTRRRSILALGMVMCLLVLATIGYYFYDQNARLRYDNLVVDQFVQEKDFQGAIKLLQAFLREHPFTIVGKDARDELADLEAQMQVYEAEQQRKTREELGRLNRVRNRYEAAWLQHVAHVEQTELSKALTDMQLVRALVAEAGMPQDLQWAASKQLEKSYRELRNYLAEAAALEREARTALDSGDWQVGRTKILELVSKYQMSPNAKRSRIPVLVVSQPAGAVIVRDGTPETVQTPTGRQVAVTPTVIYAVNEEVVQYELRRAGFETEVIKIEPRNAERADRLLTVVPTAVIEFSDQVQSSPGIAVDGRVVVGLRGGKLGISNGNGREPVVTKLAGLSEVSGVPAVSADRVVFETNVDGTLERSLVCHLVSDGSESWRVSLRAPLAFDPLVVNSRIFIADKDGRISCLSVADGHEVWSKTLSERGLPSGRPTVSRTSLAVGSSEGEVLVLDVSQGRVSSQFKLDVGVSSRVLLGRGLAIFGTEDGRMHAFDLRTRKQAWNLQLDRALVGEDLALAPDGDTVLLVGSDSSVSRVSLIGGETLAERKMGGSVRPGIAVIGQRVFVVVKASDELRNRKLRHWDILLSLGAWDLDVQWQFSDGGEFRGQLVPRPRDLYLTGSTGQVYRFQ